MAGEALIELDKMIIDEFYVNGFNQYKAVKKFKPDVSNDFASAYYNALVKKETSKKYLAEKFAVLRSETGIRSIQVLRELVLHHAADFIRLQVTKRMRGRHDSNIVRR